MVEAGELLISHDSMTAEAHGVMRRGVVGPVLGGLRGLRVGQGDVPVLERQFSIGGLWEASDR